MGGWPEVGLWNSSCWCGNLRCCQHSIANTVLFINTVLISIANAVLVLQTQYWCCKQSIASIVLHYKHSIVSILHGAACHVLEILCLQHCCGVSNTTCRTACHTACGSSVCCCTAYYCRRPRAACQWRTLVACFGARSNVTMASW